MCLGFLKFSVPLTRKITGFHHSVPILISTPALAVSDYFKTRMNIFRKIEKIESGFSRQVVLGRTLITLLETGSDDVDFLNNGQWRK